MELQGQIKSVGQVETVGANNTKKRTFVIGYKSGEYDKELAFDLFKDKAEQFNGSVGQEVTVSFDASSREYNGKWYTNCNAWKWELSGNEAHQPSPAMANVESEEEQLPF